MVWHIWKMKVNSNSPISLLTKNSNYHCVFWNTLRPLRGALGGSCALQKRAAETASGFKISSFCLLIPDVLSLLKTWPIIPLWQEQAGQANDRGQEHCCPPYRETNLQHSRLWLFNTCFAQHSFVSGHYQGFFRKRFASFCSHKKAIDVLIPPGGSCHILNKTWCNRKRISDGMVWCVPSWRESTLITPKLISFL